MKKRVYKEKKTKKKEKREKKKKRGGVSGERGGGWMEGGWALATDKRNYARKVDYRILKEYCCSLLPNEV